MLSILLSILFFIFAFISSFICPFIFSLIFIFLSIFISIPIFPIVFVGLERVLVAACTWTVAVQVFWAVEGQLRRSGVGSV